MSKRLLKKALSISLTGAMAVTAFSCAGAFMTSANAVIDEYGLVDDIQDGAILHCFDWKYTDIIADLENIAKAGFSAIQTSPVQPSEGVGAWYWLYQPLGFTVGTNELGTPEELKELCEAAHDYGIKVVVDVVANHLAGNHDNIQEDLKPDEYWHTEGAIKNYNDRYDITHGQLDMPDLNSENEYVQEVVADYVKALKNLGVDGIRWDAAKHIGLPSEGCNFWSAVTQEGLYNYGEILTGPTDKGSEDLMKEYTDYISVTDSSYATDLVRAFNKGKAPTSDGNWVKRGIDKNKLVYWGESHDTYSNGEGKDTNAVSQDVIDRAYAVAAAQSDAAVLYLSRPFATARDSIRIGVKGSTHYMAPEIAAVNHFHNAMIGKADAYGVSDNCAVITRENGGAVIVCGDSTGKYSVENVNGYVPAGTYKDEVTGNEFIVTDTTITGEIGGKGIAVIYNSEFVSKVFCDTDSDTSFTDHMLVTLMAVDMEFPVSFEVTDGENTWEDYIMQDFIEIPIGKRIDDIGVDLNDNSTVTLTISGTGKNGKDVSMTYTYYKLASRQFPEITDGGIIYDNTATGWEDVNIYVYDESGAETITNGAWPGVKMTKEADDYFSYQLPEQFAECKHIMVIFNNNGKDQIPGAMQAGLTMAYTDQKLYDGTKWVHLAGEIQQEEPVEKTKYGIVGSMTDWNSDFPMYETEKGVYVGKTKELAAGEYQFKVRADGAWDENYGEYEPEYDRTFDSQTNIRAHLDDKGYIYVKLDTTTDDEITWGVSYAVVYGDGEPEWIFTGKPSEEPEPVLSPYYAVIKNADGEPVEVFMYDGNDNTYSVTTDVLPAGTYELLVRDSKDSENFLGLYDKEKETNINTTSAILVLTEPSAIYVELSPQELYDGLYLAYATVASDGTHIGYTRSAPSSYDPKDDDQQSSEPEQSSKPEQSTDTEEPSKVDEPSNAESQQGSNNSPDSNNTNNNTNTNTNTNTNNNVNTGDSTPFIAVTLAGLLSAAVVFFTSRKKTEK